ncbi:RNA polymerase II transcription mediator complex subunit 9 [Geosmithia morbida]|uniref:Mediator of RNA polymerase II transcription subunit 9 n=1 Tax=Geosmithia morbida TaxID=1094350 RepID=A0A9P4Z2D5_9HYPO|nr:RNA polymerase II transcription mediator complex subunit 9 [Geosmithia morbida]KAF4126159.1 RNA polymerase II transcription mediator complex subunit 9 [Geosmithia morbida]
MPDSHPLALPPTLSPDSLDVLTHLSTILSEVRTTLQTSTGLEADNEKKDGPSSTAGTVGGGGGGPGSSGAPGGSGLTFKDVAGASDVIKHKLQRARDQVRTLPDMSRGLDEQEAEIRELEARIQRQRTLLQRLRDESVTLAKDQESTAPGDKMEI